MSFRFSIRSSLLDIEVAERHESIDVFLPLRPPHCSSSQWNLFFQCLIAIDVYTCSNYIHLCHPISITPDLPSSLDHTYTDEILLAHIDNIYLAHSAYIHPIMACAAEDDSDDLEGIAQGGDDEELSVGTATVVRSKHAVWLPQTSLCKGLTFIRMSKLDRGLVKLVLQGKGLQRHASRDKQNLDVQWWGQMLRRRVFVI